MPTNKQIDAIVAFVKTYHKVDAEITKLNNRAYKLYGDFYPEYPIMPQDIETSINRLLDAFLGDIDLAGYILYDRGEITEKESGKVYDMKNYKDVKQYLKDEYGI